MSNGHAFNPDLTDIDIGADTVVAIRKGLGLNITGAAKRAGVDRSRWSRWEKNGAPKRGSARVVLLDLAREVGLFPKAESSEDAGARP